MENLDQYIKRPDDMVSYLSNYGWHFNKKACDFAVSKMKKKSSATGKMESIDPWNKEQVEEVLKKSSIMLENSNLYDFVYVANMCRADFYKSSIPDEMHLAMYVKDVIDDPDASDGFIFRRWYSDMRGKGEGIPWEELL